MAPAALPPLDKVDPLQAWRPWEPTAEQPFDLKWAGHLYRRAAFGGTLAELRRAEKEGLKPTLARLMTGEPQSKVLTDFLQKEGEKIARRNNAFELRAWWLYCMLNSGHPVREKMTLFWHNHFATSITKVQRAQPMMQQNELLRKHALGKFGPFLLEMSKNPAMLVYLDSNSNVKAHPNENYAREVMELFSLGVGNYTEHDIREAARAFTGWHTDGESYEFNAGFHDDGSKTVLGEDRQLHRTVATSSASCFEAEGLRPLPRPQTLPQPSSALKNQDCRPIALLEPLCEQLRKSRLRHHRRCSAPHAGFTALLLGPCLPPAHQESGRIRAWLGPGRGVGNVAPVGAGQSSRSDGPGSLRPTERQGLDRRPGLAQHLDHPDAAELRPGRGDGHALEQCPHERPRTVRAAG